MTRFLYKVAVIVCLAFRLPRVAASPQAPHQQQRVDVQNHSKEIQLYAGNIFPEVLEPLEMLSDCVNKRLRPQKFRVTWFCFVADYHASCTALYDRLQKTVTYYAIEFSPDGKKRDHCVYKGVTDTILTRLVSDRRDGKINVPGSAPAGFDQLPRYGCIRQDLH